MKIEKASEKELRIVSKITQETISAVYSQYYPVGAVNFFKNHHNEKNIAEDISNGIVYLLYDEENTVGTVTLRENEICRLFVLPEFQHKGYGRFLLDFAEKEILKRFEKIIIDASLPAKKIYKLRGYTETDYHIIDTENGDKLCYDQMEKAN